MTDAQKNLSRKVSLDALMGASKQAPAHAASDEAPTDLVAPKVRDSELTAEEKRQVEELAQKIDFTEPALEQTYGTNVQRAMAEISDTVLEKVNSKDTGEAGELLRSLLATVDKNSLSGVRKVPILGDIVMKADQVRLEYQKVSPQIDEITHKLELNRTQMINDIATYDNLYENNVQQYRELRMYVLAGTQALDRFRREELPALEAEAEASSDPMASQVLKDFKNKLDRFEKHLDDLDRVCVVALQNCPQIKILQAADQVISDKIATTVNVTVPLWKSQMVIALGLEHQRSALDLQKGVDDVTNRLMVENAKALHQGAVDTAKANQRGVVDIETLEQVNTELINTIRDTIDAQEEGRKKRLEAQTRIAAIESDLKQALLDQSKRM
ncbi:MAG: toxic anion resistance protein [Atopobiaceae bacterium]|jgi:uncharacterized protein YaaN involved in tellurite resistance